MSNGSVPPVSLVRLIVGEGEGDGDDLAGTGEALVVGLGDALVAGAIAAEGDGVGDAKLTGGSVPVPFPVDSAGSVPIFEAGDGDGVCLAALLVLI